MREETARAETRIQFAEWVRARREAAGYATQAALAEAMALHGDAAVNPNYVWQLENGRVGVPKQPLLRQLADALLVSEADVLRAAGLITAPVANGDQPPAAFRDLTRPKELRIVEGLPAASDTALDVILSILQMGQEGTN